MTATRRRKLVPIATCIGCGCSDMQACHDDLDGSCGWLEVDRRSRLGVCTACPASLKRWKRGDRAKREDRR